MDVIEHFWKFLFLSHMDVIDVQKCQLPSGGDSEKKKEKVHSLLLFLPFSLCFNLPAASIIPPPYVHIIDSELLSPPASPIQKDLVHREEAQQVGQTCTFRQTGLWRLPCRNLPLFWDSSLWLEGLIGFPNSLRNSSKLK